MDPDLEYVIRQILGDALTAGKDHRGQTELAIWAVRQGRHEFVCAVRVFERGGGRILALARKKEAG